MAYVHSMKKSTLWILGTLILISGCQSKTDLKNPDLINPTENAAATKTQDDLVGNWLAQEAGGPIAEENRMILTAILEKRNPGITLGAIRGIWTQVVAGHNVRMLIDYTEKAQSGIMTVVLFHDLEGNVFLSSIEL